MQDPTFEVVSMTPDWAERILRQKNNMNRKIRRSKLMMYTRSIESGEWKVTNQGIALDPEGNLLDGQHRLAAIIKARKAVRILLGTNCDPSTFGVIDIGATRTAGDMLTLSGCTSNHNTLAAAMKMYINYIEFPKAKWGHVNCPNHAKIVKYWNDKQDIIETYYPFLIKCHRQFRCFSQSAALTFSLIADDYEWRLDEIMEYFTLLATGANLPADSSILSFRNQLTNPAFRKRGSHVAQQQLNSHIKCFNDWKTGKPVKKFISPSTPPMLEIVPRDHIVGTNILELIKKES
jgi:hypothetical protein